MTDKVKEIKENIEKFLSESIDQQNKHIDYIHYNSYKHFGIIPKDWEFSTFSKFVKDGYYEQNWLVDDKIFKDIDCE